MTIPQVSNSNFPKMDVVFASNNFDLRGTATLDINGFLFQLGNSTASAITPTGSFIGSPASKLIIYGALSLPLKFAQTSVGSSNALATFSLNSAGQTVTLGSPVWVYENYYPLAGTLESGGNLTMVSSATTVSNISAIYAGADIMGDVVVQSYFTGGSLAYRRYRFVSSPIDDAKPNVLQLFGFDEAVEDILERTRQASGGVIEASLENLARMVEGT